MKFKSFLRNYAILFVLIGITAIFAILNPKVFLTLNNFFTISKSVAMVGIASVGMTMVMLTGGLDLSIGTMQGFSGIIVAYFMVNAGLHPVLAIIVTLFFGIIVGLFNGLIVTRLNVNSFIVTLSMMTILRGAAYLFTAGNPIYGFSENFAKFGRGYWFGVIPIPVFVLAGIFIIGHFFLNNTYLGRYLYATGGNQEAARLSGINVKNVKVMAFILCSVLASISGIILAAKLNSGQPAAGEGFEFDVITAVVLGGVSLSGGEGRLRDVLMGVFIIGVLTNGMIVMGVNQYFQWIIKGLVLIGAVAMDNISYISKDVSNLNMNLNKK